MKAEKTALVTGANSGLGFEAAAQLADEGYSKVIITARTQEKADKAKMELTERTGKDVFDTLVLETSEVRTATKAFLELSRRGDKIDFLLLNAGMVPAEFTANSDGYDIATASAVIGHHALTLHLLNEGLLSENGRIVAAGSEIVRNDLSGFSADIEDWKTIANDSYDGDLVRTMIAAAKYELRNKYVGMQAYSYAKNFVSWWAYALSRRLPKGMAVYSVSPGSVPSTNGGRNMPFVMRKVMLPMMTRFGRFIGMAQSVADGAGRYLAVRDYVVNGNNGAFFASRPTKMVGPIVKQNTPHLLDEDLQEAGWQTVVEMTHGIDIQLKAAA